MSFIKKDKEDSSSLWDFVFLAVLLAVGFGFWWYYNSTKSGTIEGFQRADSLYQAGQYQSALDLYKKLDNSDYLEQVHDSILGERLSVLESLLIFLKADSLFNMGVYQEAQELYQELEPSDLSIEKKQILAHRLDTLTQLVK